MDGPLQGLEMVLSRIGSLVKGIYDSDKDVLLRLREAVTPETPWGNFKTIEAAIMDVADDIAYA
jgi:dGTPase